jgi:hypothetical protein
MLPGKALRLALTGVSVTRFEGLLCRAVQSGTLYGFMHRNLAQDFETSLREYLQLGKNARLAPRSEKEGAIVCLTAKVRVESVLDLTTESVQKALGTER